MQFGHRCHALSLASIRSHPFDQFPYIVNASDNPGDGASRLPLRQFVQLQLCRLPLLVLHFQRQESATVAGEDVGPASALVAVPVIIHCVAIRQAVQVVEDLLLDEAFSQCRFPRFPGTLSTLANAPGDPWPARS